MLKKSLTLKNATLIQPLRHQASRMSLGANKAANSQQYREKSSHLLIVSHQNPGFGCQRSAPDFLDAVVRNALKGQVNVHDCTRFLEGRKNPEKRHKTRHQNLCGAQGSKPSLVLRWTPKKKTGSYGCSLRESLAGDRIRVPKGWLLLLKATQNE